ncbi:hypothetical protein E4U52_003651 [Claviceps spartinae]|nr:hypothetical protein E4U52_003651 [Claviceps spartinae]
MGTPSTLQESEKFLYGGLEYECEVVTRYKQFGLHPIILGDVLPKPLTCVSDVNKEPRCRIMLKLGSGAFATVCLARDLVDKRYVAVKVGHGSNNPLPDRECEILSQIREPGPGKHGYERVIKLFDAFVVEGPNGFHQCLVTEVHGNLGIALPQLEQFEEDDIIEFFGTPDIVPVVHWDPNFPLNSTPPYLVHSVSIGYFLQKRKAFSAGSVTSKILDFGRAYRMSQVTPNLLGAAPMMIRPPEDVLHELCHGTTGSTWSEAADTWALGCTLHHVRSGLELVSTWGSLEKFLFRAIQFGGPPPETWPKVWIKQDQQHDNSLHDRDKVWGVPVNEEALKFINFLKRMIITNPDERTPMTVLLTDPFMAERRKAEENI